MHCESMDLDDHDTESVVSREDATRIPKSLRTRYWTSSEEVRLVELWRRNFSEVVTLQKNMPIFRKIADGMKDYNFQVNGQECRRKINSLKNKYISEKRRLQNKQQPSQPLWRMYPIIKCLLEQPYEQQNLLHEDNILNELSQKMAAEPSAATTAAVLPAPSSNPMDTCYPTWNITPHQSLPSHNNMYNRLYTTEPPYTLPSASEQTAHTQVAFSKYLRKRLTITVIQQLRIHNQFLMERNISARKLLKLEEKKFKHLESTLQQWHQKQIQTLNTLEVKGR